MSLQGAMVVLETEGCDVKWTRKRCSRTRVKTETEAIYESVFYVHFYKLAM